MIKKVKNTASWTYIVNYLNGKEIGMFLEKELRKTNQKELRIEEICKRKGNELYVKWEGYNNSLNSWINKEDVIV